MTDPTTATIIALRDAGLAWSDIAARLKITPEQARWRYRAAVKGSNAVRRVDAPARNEAADALEHGMKKRRMRTHGDTADVECEVPRLVTTEAEAMLAAEVDADLWEAIGLEVRHYPMYANKRMVQGTYVKLRLKRRTNLAPSAMVDALVEGAMQARLAFPAPAIRRSRTPNAQVVVVSDPHFGKLCWSKGTGGMDYDVDIAYTTLVEGAASLIRQSGPVEKRYIVSLGDFFHFDTLSGTTTGGTSVDRDSRVPKILEVGSEALARIVRGSARSADTELVIVPGNHDEVLSAALQRIMVAEFRRSGTVTVDDTHTRRKAREYGRNLLGFNHGDKRKKELCANLAIEHPEAWGRTRYREIHTGHLHSEGERYEGTLTHAGVTLRTHRSLTPADQWHADEGYMGSPRGMSAWIYDKRGGLAGMRMYDPDLARVAA